MNSVVPSPYPAQGEEIDGRYRVEHVLGEGGMGMVARAVDMLMRQTVAIKFMNPQFLTFPGAAQRFLQEAQASVAIRSEHVVHTLNVGKLPNGAPYLVMPCLEGKDLADLLLADGAPGLPIPRAVYFTLQILRGLQAAHAVGIIHRDMKPSNCFVVKHEGEDDFVKILDFGISKVAQPQGGASLTQTNSALGTPLYMSPEQAKSPRDVDGRSDLYSVGVILYELLTGHTPFFSESGEFTEILFKLFTADPPPIQSTRPDLPDGLAAAVHRALARELKDRFAAAEDMAEALAPFADARAAHLLKRLRGFAPEQARSMPPPADMALPASMEIFSRLDAKPATDVMARRPTTDVMQGPPVTQLMDGAPRARAASTPGSEHASIVPTAEEARALPEEAIARTQYGGVHDVPSPPRPPGVQTDLGASRDAVDGERAPPRRSPAVYALPVLALLVIAGVGLAVQHRTSTHEDARKDVAGTPSATTLPPPTESPSTTASAPPVASSAPSAAPSTSTFAKPPRVPAGTTTSPPAPINSFDNSAGKTPAFP